MKSSIRRAAAYLADPKCMIFGVAIFTLIWVSIHSEFRFHRNMHLAALLLAASLLILLNKLWSNLVAAIFSGYLPLEIWREFWMLARNAEVPMFSSEHFSYFFGNIDLEGGALMFIVPTLMMSTRSVFAILRLKEVPGVDGSSNPV
jgi:hypothetical protein